MRKSAAAESAGGMVLLYSPCPDLEVAKRIGNALLNGRLAGCINILPRMVSLYDWDGAREETEEVVMLAKTSAARAEKARDFIAREHPYEVPAVLTLPLSDVNPAYREWLIAQLEVSSAISD
jgi:periplasmic divalent cation tolerance protein